MISQWIIGICVTAIFVLGIVAIAASAYGNWVRNFYAKRDRLQTLFGKDKRNPG